jgi:tetratricopeptide (TPR) repeat protein
MSLKLFISLALAGLLVLVGLGAVSDVVLQRHRGQLAQLGALGSDERDEAISKVKDNLELAAGLAPWSPHPQQAKLSLASHLAELGIDNAPNWDDLQKAFLAAARNAPTWAEAYIGVAKIYLVDRQIFESAPNLWADMLATAERLSPTMSYVQHLWGNLLFKALPGKEPPSGDNVADICRHFGRGLALQGEIVNWPLINDAYSICFGLTRNLDMLKLLMPANPGLWRLWGEHLCGGSNQVWRNLRPRIEQWLFADRRAPMSCLAFARGLSQDCMAEAVDLMMTCLRRYPQFSEGWTWLVQNLERADAALPENQLAELTQLGLSQGALNAKHITALSKALCNRGMFSLASQALEAGLGLPGRNDEVMEQVANCLAECGQAQAAMEMLGGIVARRPNAAWAWLTLGRLQMDAGQVLNGEESLSRALKLDPNNRKAIEYLKRGGVY